MNKPRDPFDIPLTSFQNRLFRNIGLGLVVGLLAALLSETLVISELETLIYDWRTAERPFSPERRPPVTLVLISDDSQAKHAPNDEAYNTYLAELVKEISGRKPAVIGLDLILTGMTPETPGAESLRSAIRLAGNVVLSGRALPNPRFGLKNFPPPLYLKEVALAGGFQHLLSDAHGKTREAFIRRELTGIQESNALAVLLAQHAEGNNLPDSFHLLRSKWWATPFTFQSPTDPYTGHILIKYYGTRSEVGDTGGTFPCLEADLNRLKTMADHFFRDRVVIIGSALSNEDNRHLTPHGPPRMWTSEIIANMTEMILSGDYVRSLTRWGRLVWLMLVGFVAAILCTNRKLLPIVLFILVYSLVLATTLKRGFYDANLIFPFLTTLIVPWLTAIATVAARVMLDDREIRLLREVFGRSVSPAIAQELVAKISNERTKKKTAGMEVLSEECVSTILFLDVANFTPLSEAFTPERLFVFTNELLDRFSDSVFQNNGSLIRYTGDGLIALFGRPIQQEDHAALACEAALQMAAELDALNRRREENGEPQVQIRIGINTGKMVVGLVGGHQRYDYSVLGNEVNVAARFERLNKDFGTTILIGDETFKMLEDQYICRPLGSISLKGKTHQVPVYELVCRTGEVIPEYLRNFLRAYERGFLCIRDNRADEAVEAFSEALMYKPDDLATQKLLSRSEERTQTHIPGDTTRKR